MTTYSQPEIRTAVDQTLKFIKAVRENPQALMTLLEKVAGGLQIKQVAQQIANLNRQIKEMKEWAEE